MSDKRTKKTIENQIRESKSDMKELETIAKQTCVPEIKPYLNVAISQLSHSINLDELILELEFKTGERK